MAPVPKKDIGFAVLIAFNLIVLTLPSERLAGSALASKDESRGLYNSYLANWIEVTKLVLHLLFFFHVLVELTSQKKLFFTNTKLVGGVFSTRGLNMLDLAIVVESWMRFIPRAYKLNDSWIDTTTGFDPAVFRFFHICAFLLLMEGIPKLSLVMGVVQASFEKVVGPVAIYSIMMVVFAVGAHVLFGDDLHFNCCPEDYSVEECREAALAKEDPNMEVCASTKLARKWEGYECSAEGYKCMEGAAPMYDQFTFDTVGHSTAALFRVSIFGGVLENLLWTQDAVGWLAPLVWFVMFGAIFNLIIINMFPGSVCLTMRERLLEIEAEKKADTGGDSGGGLTEFELYMKGIQKEDEKDIDACIKALAPPEKKSAEEVAKAEEEGSAAAENERSALEYQVLDETSPFNITILFLIFVYFLVMAMGDVVEPFDGESTKTFKEKWWNETNYEWKHWNASYINITRNGTTNWKVDADTFIFRNETFNGTWYKNVTGPFYKSWWSRWTPDPVADNPQVIINIFFTLVFGLECLFRFGVLGKERYWFAPGSTKWWNRFDVTVVVFGIIDIIVDTLPGRARFKNLTLLRAIRFLKFAKTLRVAALAKPSRLKMIAGKLDYDFAGICALIVDLSGWIGATVLMLALFWFFMAIVGMQLFAGRVFRHGNVDDNLPLHNAALFNFDTFPMAYYTVAFSTFLIDVDLIIYEGSAGTKGFASIYFLAAILVGRYIIMSVVIAALFNQTKAWNLDHIEESGKKAMLAAYTMDNRLSKLLYRFVWLKWKKLVSSSAESTQQVKLLPGPEIEEKGLFAGPMALTLFHPNDPLRKKVAAFFENEFASVMIDFFYAVLSLFSLLVLCWEAENDFMPPTWLWRVIVFLFLFFEIVAKSIAYEFLPINYGAYLTHPGNQVDFFLFIITAVEIGVVASLPKKDFNYSWVYLGLFRAMRVPRGLRIIGYSASMSGLTTGALESLEFAMNTSKKALGHVALFIIFWCMLVGTVGMHVFSGTFYWCDYTETTNPATDIGILVEGVSKFRCQNSTALGSEFREDRMTFDSFGEGLLTALRMFTLGEYSPTFFAGINSVTKGIDGSPRSQMRQNSAGTGVFTLFAALGNFLLMYMFIAVIYGAFIHKLYSGGKVITPSYKHAKWSAYALRLSWVRPISDPNPPAEDSALYLPYSIVSSKAYKALFSLVITLNVIFYFYWGSVYGVTSADIPDDAGWIKLTNLIFVIIFCGGDFTLRLFGYCIADLLGDDKQFTTLVLHAVTMVIPDVFGFAATGALRSAFVMMGACRILIIIPQWPTLWTLGFGILSTFGRIMPVLGSASVATVIYATFLLILYQDLDFTDLGDRSWFEENDVQGDLELRQRHLSNGFDSLSSAMKLLFFATISGDLPMVLDGIWDQTSGAKRVLAPILFFSYAVLVRIVMLNLVLLIVIHMFETSAEEHPDLMMEQINDFKEKWHDIDERGDGYIEVSRLDDVLRELHAPLGIRDAKAISDPPKFRVTRFAQMVLRAVNGWKIDDLKEEHEALLVRRRRAANPEEELEYDAAQPCEIFLDEEEPAGKVVHKGFCLGDEIQITWTDLYGKNLNDEFDKFTIGFTAALKGFHEIALFEDLKRLPDDEEFEERQTFALDILSKIKVAVALDAIKHDNQLDEEGKKVNHFLIKKSLLQRISPEIYRYRFAETFKKETRRWLKNIPDYGFNQTSYYEARQLTAALKDEISAMQSRLEVLRAMPKNSPMSIQDRPVIRNYVKHLDDLVHKIDNEKSKYAHKIWVPASFAKKGECYTKKRRPVYSVCMSEAGDVLVTVSEGPNLKSTGGPSSYVTFWSRNKKVNKEDEDDEEEEVKEEEVVEWRPFKAEHLIAHSSASRCVACTTDAKLVFVGGREDVIRAYGKVKQTAVEKRKHGKRLRYRSNATMDVDADVHQIVVYNDILLSALDNGFCFIHNFRGGEALQRIQINGQKMPVYSIAIMDLTGGDPALMAQGALQAFVGDATGHLRACPFQDSSSWLSSSVWESTCKVQHNETFPVTCVTTDPKSRLIYSAGSNGRVRVWKFTAKADDKKNLARLGDKPKFPEDWLSAEDMSAITTETISHGWLEETHSNTITAMMACNGVMFTASLDLAVNCYVKPDLESKEIGPGAPPDVYEHCVYNYSSAEGAVTAFCASEKELVVVDESGKINVIAPKRFREDPKFTEIEPEWPKGPEIVRTSDSDEEKPLFFDQKRWGEGEHAAAPPMSGWKSERQAFFESVRFIYGMREKGAKADIITLASIFYGRTCKWVSNAGDSLWLPDGERPPASRDVKWQRQAEFMEKCPEKGIPDELNIETAAVPLLWMWQIMAEVAAITPSLDPECGLSAEAFENLKKFVSHPLNSNPLVKGRIFEERQQARKPGGAVYWGGAGDPVVRTDAFIEIIKSCLVYLEYYETSLMKRVFVKRNSIGGRRKPNGNVIGGHKVFDILVWDEWRRRPEGLNTRMPRFIAKTMAAPRALRNMDNNEFTGELLETYFQDRDPHVRVTDKDKEGTIVELMKPEMGKDGYIGPLKARGEWSLDGSGLMGIEPPPEEPEESESESDGEDSDEFEVDEDGEFLNVPGVPVELSEETKEDPDAPVPWVPKGSQVSSLMDAYKVSGGGMSFYEPSKAVAAAEDEKKEDEGHAPTQVVEEVEMTTKVSEVKEPDFSLFGFFGWGTPATEEPAPSEEPPRVLSTAELAEQRRNEAKAIVDDDVILSEEVLEAEQAARRAQEEVSRGSWGCYLCTMMQFELCRLLLV